MLRCNNGPELACSAIAGWASGQIGLHLSPPGEPWRSGYVESFNSRIRDECLNINTVWSLIQARVAISDWKHDYNHHRRLGPGHWCGMARDPIIPDQATPPGRQPSCNKRPRSSRMARWWVILPSVMVKM